MSVLPWYILPECILCGFFPLLTMVNLTFQNISLIVCLHTFHAICSCLYIVFYFPDVSSIKLIRWGELLYALRVSSTILVRQWAITLCSKVGCKLIWRCKHHVVWNWTWNIVCEAISLRLLVLFFGVVRYVRCVRRGDKYVILFVSSILHMMIYSGTVKYQGYTLQPPLTYMLLAPDLQEGMSTILSPLICFRLFRELIFSVNPTASGRSTVMHLN